MNVKVGRAGEIGEIDKGGRSHTCRCRGAVNSLMYGKDIYFIQQAVFKLCYVILIRRSKSVRLSWLMEYCSARNNHCMHYPQLVLFQGTRVQCFAFVLEQSMLLDSHRKISHECRYNKCFVPDSFSLPRLQLLLWCQI